MLPKQHLIFGFIFSIVVYLIFPQIGIIGLLIILSSTVLIDVDHYLYYVYKKKDFSLGNSYKWFLKKREKLKKLSKKQKNKIYVCFCFLHGIEVLIFLFILGKFLSVYFYFVLIGFTFHLFLDFVDDIVNQNPFRKISFIYNFFKFKNFEVFGVNMHNFLLKRLVSFERKNLRGNTGQAVKNSSYQLTQTLVGKIGSLFFTIIIARMLLPELFGLYSLALSTVVLFSAFSDLGISTALITFVSKKLSEKKPSKAKAYFNTLMKFKVFLLFATSLVLIASAYFISETYYHKPIFLALLAGGLYIPLIGFAGFLESNFKAQNNFRYPLFKEIIFQILRLTIIPVLILLLLKKISSPLLIFWIILGLSFCYFVSLFFLYFLSKKSVLFLKAKKEKLTIKEKKELQKFILPLSATALSGMFFGYVDVVMLGHFVLKQFIGYYSAALALIGSATALLGFAGGALLPIFSRLKEKSLEKNFKKIRNFLVIISLSGVLFTFALAPFIVEMIYGTAYFNSILILRIFSILIFIAPLTAIYNTYFISQERTLIVAKLLIFTTILNIILNYFLITYGLKFGMLQALLGATIATIFSRFIYFMGLVMFRKN